MSSPLPSPFLATGLEYALHLSTMSGRIICGVLVGLSLCSWTVMLLKLFRLGRWRRANAAFLQIFRHAAHPLAMFQSSEHFDLSPFYHVYHQAAREMAYQLAGVDLPDKTFTKRLQGAGRINPSQMGVVHAAMERSVADAALKLEAYMSVVAIALSGAPFIGLLGTVWGMMDSFAALGGTSEAASLQLMAPGMCSALLTTVVALLVAIPSLFGYNFLVSRIRAMIVRMDNFAGDLASIFDRHYVDHRSAADELPSLGVLGSPNLPAFTGTPASSMPHPMSTTPVTGPSATLPTGL